LFAVAANIVFHRFISFVIGPGTD